MAQLTLVDGRDNVIGYEEKEKCHDGEGLLHRAFSVFLFNERGEVLIQQRSAAKRLWPLYWSNSCCSHPAKGEDYQEAARRRLKEELGISCPLTLLYKFVYQAAYGSAGSEHELCAVLVGQSSEAIKLDPGEVADFRWIDLGALAAEIGRSPESFTPWTKMEVEELLKSHAAAIPGRERGE